MAKVRETTMKGRMGGLQRLLARLNSNREELEHLEPSRSRFEDLVARMEEAANRQAAHTAAKQAASQELRGFLTEGERMATVLQLAVKQHYGIQAEKLAEFGLQPFRGRVRKAVSEQKPPAPPPAQEPTGPVAGGETNP